jgi:hypothetical protein
MNSKSKEVTNTKTGQATRNFSLGFVVKRSSSGNSDIMGPKSSLKSKTFLK